ncbi:hypothetical protein [Tunturiibacter gelidoferens]|uniref:P-type conjugative transfer protein TrbJ n=1 Tax=Tunturiibacter lichenicola TaxID=2051959 RepID=A0A7Y9NRB0_9BACT|nr:hypothetical protein [Edaphobacter lichenicola]NYF54111.1 hypothetical protein [Edaphobacter lichenicola]
MRKEAYTARWLALAGGLLAFASAMPANAQFGGVVLDPTQSAHAVIQISNEGKALVNQATSIAQGSQANLTLSQQLIQDIQMAGTALKIYNQSITTYNTIFNNLKYFNSKQIWRTAENALMASSVQNQYGETSGLQAQLNGQGQNASTVWKLMNLAVSGTSSSFWGNQIVGASDRLSTLAHIEAMDAASTQCLAAVGAYNQSRTTNLAPNTALDTSIYDTTTATNSEVEQLNLLNVAGSQRMQEQKAQGQLQACIAAQNAVSNMDKRNAASLTINDAAYKLTQQSSNPTYAGNESTTWTTYF